MYGIGWATGAVIATISFQHFGGKPTILIGALIYSGGMIGASYLTDIYAFLGVLLSASGLGPAIMCLPATYLSWVTLPNNKGLATGVAWLFYGFAGAVFGISFTFLVNPNNESPGRTITSGNQTERIFTESVAGRVPMALRVMSIVMLVLNAVAVMLVYEVKEKSVRKQLSASVVAKNVDDTSVQGCPSLRHALHTSSLYILFLYFWLCFEFPMIFNYQYKNYELQYTTNDHLLSITGTVGMFVNAWTRLLVSWLADYISFRSLMLGVMGVMMVLGVTVQWIVQFPYVYALWVCLILACYGSLYSPITLVCGQIYGPRVGAQVFSLVGQGQVVSYLLMIPITVFLIQPYGYNTAFFVLGLTPGLAALLLFFLRTKYDWEDGSIVRPLKSAI